MFNGENNLNTIKKFFGEDRPVSMTELKELSKEEREDLAKQVHALPE